MSEPAQPSAPPPTAVPDPPAEAAAATEYLILAQDKTGYWTEQKKIKARGSNAALREWLKGTTAVEGTYVAVPSRSWKPVTVSTETQTKLTFK